MLCTYVYLRHILCTYVHLRQILGITCLALSNLLLFPSFASDPMHSKVLEASPTMGMNRNKTSTTVHIPCNTIHNTTYLMQKNNRNGCTLGWHIKGSNTAIFLY